jgi:hypothetical protein
MVLVGPIAVDIAPDSFADAAPLIPVAAAGMVWPALLRTVNQQTMWPGRTKVTFIFCAIVAAIVFIATTALLAPEIDIYAAPIGMVAGLAPPCAYLFIRSQRGPDRIAFPYREVGTALVVAAAVGTAYELLPAVSIFVDIVIALAFAALYVALLLWLRVIPESHWEALTHMLRSLASGRPDRFQPRRGLRALEQHERDALRSAVEGSWAAGADASGGVPGGANGSPDDLMRSLRTAGERGGVPVGEATALDPEIAEYLFSSEPTALRNATMRRLLGEGADAADLRALEDLVSHLAAVPDGAWAGRKKSEDATS